MNKTHNLNKSNERFIKYKFNYTSLKFIYLINYLYNLLFSKNVKKHIDMLWI